MQVIQKYMNSPLRNYNYIVYSEHTKEAIFIDPFDIDVTLPICEELGLTPKYLLNTHYHHDHIKDNDRFLAMPGVKELKLKDQEVFNLSSNESLKAIHTPGHIPDHMCFILSDERGEFGFISGDAVFNAGIGNTKNGGNLDDHYNSTTMLRNILSSNLELYPSHDYLLTNLKFAEIIEPENLDVKKLIEKREKQNLDQEFINTNIETELKINPFFRLKEIKQKSEYKDLTEKELFLHLRSERDRF